MAEQVFGGLFGALIVDGGPSLPVTNDHVLLVGDITLDVTGAPAPATPAQRMAGREGALVLVNGQHQPVVAAVPGAAQIVNTCVARVLSVRLDGHALVQVAHDGNLLTGPAARNRVILAPGARADVVVTPRGTGRFDLVTEPYDRGSTGMIGNPAADGPITLLTLVSGGTGVPASALPSALPAEPSPPPASVQRDIAFQMGMGPAEPGSADPDGTGGGMGGGGMAFTIDGRSFDPARTDQTVVAGTTEEWTVRNTGPLAHPFHLHVWPFTVAASSDGAQPSGVPQDVVLVPAGGWVRIRIPFTRHTGRSVYHCHILDHEDLGMMATIDVGGS